MTQNAGITYKHQLPEEVSGCSLNFYKGVTVKDYHAQNGGVQAELTEAALRLYPDGQGQQFIMDIGCGSGLSTFHVQQKYLFYPIGVDISVEMLNIATKFTGLPAGKPVSPDYSCTNFAQPFPFRDNLFDGAISISAVQWLRKKEEVDIFFKELFRCLRDKSFAILQYYPKDNAHAQLLLKGAIEAGFDGEVVMDVPHRTNQRKLFLCLQKQPEIAFCQLLPDKNCELAFPYDGICALAWKERILKQTIIVTENLAKMQKAPLPQVLIRQHIIRALEYIQIAKGGKKRWKYELSEEQKRLLNYFQERFQSKESVKFSELQTEYYEEMMQLLHDVKRL